MAQPPRATLSKGFSERMKRRKKEEEMVKNKERKRETGTSEGTGTTSITCRPTLPFYVLPLSFQWFPIQNKNYFASPYLATFICRSETETGAAASSPRMG
jgi:hypothetical protein